MDLESEVDKYRNIIKNNPDITPAIAAIMVILEFVKNGKYQTIQGLSDDITCIQQAINEVARSSISILSATKYLKRSITHTSLDHTNFEECKQVLYERGQIFLSKAREADIKIAEKAWEYIVDGSSILTHGYCKVIYHVILEASRRNLSFQVFVTESSPEFSGKLMYDKLIKAEIPCTLIIDASVAHFMRKIDYVFLGAECICENGGIINKVGSYTIAVCAESMERPVYVFAESFKFSKIFPLNNRDLANELKPLNFFQGESKDHPLVDYTPPKYLRCLTSEFDSLTADKVYTEIARLYSDDVDEPFYIF